MFTIRNHLGSVSTRQSHAFSPPLWLCLFFGRIPAERRQTLPARKLGDSHVGLGVESVQEKYNVRCRYTVLLELCVDEELLMRFLSERGNDELEDGEGDLSVDDYDDIHAVNSRLFVHCRNDQQANSERDRAANRYAPC